MKNELKPCPFCGGEASLHIHDRYGVECDNCSMGLGCIKLTKEEAIQAWNTRVDLNPTTHLFDCLTDKQKEKAKRKGIRKAKRADRIAKIINWFSK